MILINPLQVVLWTFRRNEHDVVNLYNSLSPVMQLATGGNMLNFGYWKENPADPATAQRNLCSFVGKVAELGVAKNMVDVGSGLSAPAAHWKSTYGSLDVNCVNINYDQLATASKSVCNKVASSNNTSGVLSLQQADDDISLVNSTSTLLPFSDKSVDRVVALESAQHFKPLDRFVEESKRILKQDGLLVIAIPVTKIQAKPLRAFLKLGILSLTWSSEHYQLDYVTSTIRSRGFKITDVMHIGHQVYEPLADYYILNRKELRQRILREYSSFLENILYKSLLRMKYVSQKEIIDYTIIKCTC